MDIPDEIIQDHRRIYYVLSICANLTVHKSGHMPLSPGESFTYSGAGVGAVACAAAEPAPSRRCTSRQKRAG
jgi:hypothetical protein